MKDVLKKIGSFLLLVGLLVLWSFVQSEQDKNLVKEVKIHINATKGDPFMDQKDVMDLVYSRLDTLEAKPLGNLHLNEVEDLLESDPAVKNAEAYVRMQGDVHLDVELKKVIARIKPDSTNGFYVDEDGNVMPWVPKFTPRVLTVSGHLSHYNRFTKDSLAQLDLTQHSKLIADVYELAKLVQKDQYWQAQVGQVYIEKNGDAVIIPLVGDHEFIIGDLRDCEKKLEKIKLFHNEIAQKVGWNKYKVVNLKFENQIVCK